MPLYAATASEQDWERYEWTLILNAERAGLGDYARGNRDRYAKLGGREQLGFGLWLFAGAISLTCMAGDTALYPGVTATE